MATREKVRKKKGRTKVAVVEEMPKEDTDHPTGEGSTEGSRETIVVSPAPSHATADSVPGSGSERPGSAAKRPGSGTSRPSSAATRGEGDDVRGGSGGQRPASGASKPPRPPSARRPEAEEDQTTGSSSGVPRVLSAASLASAGSERMFQNAVSPAPLGGSQASLRSREAWGDRSEVFASQASVKSAADSETAVQEYDEHAYVPFSMAMQTITRITRDMKHMKSSHVAVVRRIEGHYQQVETQSQDRFKDFVSSLRHEYTDKVKNFRHVIEVYRLELKEREEHFDVTLRSISERNRDLLTDKKCLLIQNKVQHDGFHQEKEAAFRDLVLSVDESQAELKRVREELEKSQGRVSELQQGLEEQEASLSEVQQDNKALLQEVTKLKKSPPGVTAATAVVVTSGNTAEAEALQQQLSAEHERSAEERELRHREQETATDERKRLLDELNDAKKAAAEAEGKLEAVRPQLAQLQMVREERDVLQEQLMVVAAAAQPAGDGDKERIEAQIAELRSQQELMREERDKMDKDLRAWEDQFRKKNGRDPTPEDRTTSAGELAVSRQEADDMIAKLEAKVKALESILAGKVPEVHVTEVKVIPPEPVIKTVEVVQPDPETERQLSSAREEVTSLSSRLGDQQNEVAALRQQVAVAGSVAVTDGESEALRRRIRELEEEAAAGERRERDMQRDLEKLVRQHEREARKRAAAADGAALDRLLRAVLQEAKEVQQIVPEAGTEIDTRLADVSHVSSGVKGSASKAEKDYANWTRAFEKKHKRAPSAKDRDNEGKTLYQEVQRCQTSSAEHSTRLAALQALKAGTPPADVSSAAPTSGTAAEVDRLQETIAELEIKAEEASRDKEQAERLVDEARSELREKEDEVAALRVSSAAVLPATTSGAGSAELEELERQLSESRGARDEAEAELAEMRAARDAEREEVDRLNRQLANQSDDMEASRGAAEARDAAARAALQQQVSDMQQRLTEREKRVSELEEARLQNIPVDAAQEVKQARQKQEAAEQEKKLVAKASVGLTAENAELKAKLDSLQKSLAAHRSSANELEAKLKTVRGEQETKIRQMTSQFDKKEQQRSAEDRKRIAGLERKIRELESIGGAVAVGAQRVATAKGGGASDAQLVAARREISELNTRIKQLEAELKRGARPETAAPGGDRTQQKKQEKVLKELEKKLEMERAKNEKLNEKAKVYESSGKDIAKSLADKEVELRRLKDELSKLGVAAKEGVEAAAMVGELKAEVKKLTEENRTLAENYNTERVMRKKYYNMVEDMKGKIRVYCRARPMSKSELDRGNHSVTVSPDEYSINVTTARGQKDFQFDTVFMEDSSQERVFEDTNNLIQSAVDGYNVCIFAYGQTGSGKTFTMIGDKEQNFPGIAPRAFTRIYDLLEENKKKFAYTVQVYMLELYNDRLLDLFDKAGGPDEKMEIKKDKKGMVYIQGAEIKNASNAKELFTLFELGSKGRHTASTKMNADSSRSHLVVGVVIETTNRSTGQVIKGKLSLVDLAGSERAAKTGATAEQLREAMSINKSLSALGDVISALSSEQSFIPYRNNKLTMLMQDSLGGNAKTLMFVNISPADYNADETVVSLTYASRVKLITNDAQKNSDNKEITRLKAMIAKLKKGEAVEEED